MQHHDAITEMQIIKTICDVPERRNALLSQLDVVDFGHPTTLQIFNRMMVFIENGKDIPSSNVLAQDQALETSAIQLLQNDHCKLLVSDIDIETSLEIVKGKTKARRLMKVLTDSVSVMSDHNPDVDNVLESLESEIEQCHTKADDSEMVHYSHSNKEILVENFTQDLTTSDEFDFVRTGFKAFDDRTGGLRRGNVLVTASVPGGGKTAMALQMAINQYRMGYNVLFVSYEMDEIELRYRLLSSVSQIKHSDISLKKIAKSKEKMKILMDRFVSWLDQGQKRENTFTVWNPTKELNIHEIGMAAKHGEYDCIYVDYISLLKSNPKKPMWENLGDHARNAKLVANNLKTVFVLLAQYDDEGNKLKYSRAIQANANFVWVWEHGEKEKESGIIEVKQLKARNAPQYNFHLIKDFSVFSFQDYMGQLPEDDPEPSKNPKKPKDPKAPNGAAQPPPEKGIPRMPQLL